MNTLKKILTYSMLISNIFAQTAEFKNLTSTSNLFRGNAKNKALYKAAYPEKISYIERFTEDYSRSLVVVKNKAKVVAWIYYRGLVSGSETNANIPVTSFDLNGKTIYIFAVTDYRAEKFSIGLLESRDQLYPEELNSNKSIYIKGDPFILADLEHKVNNKKSSYRASKLINTKTFVKSNKTLIEFTDIKIKVNDENIDMILNSKVGAYKFNIDKKTLEITKEVK